MKDLRRLTPRWDQLVFVTLVLAMGCQNNQFVVDQEFADSALQGVTCGDPKSLMLDQYKIMLLDDQVKPQKEQVLKLLREKIKQQRPQASEAQLTVIEASYLKWIELIEVKAIDNKQLSKLDKLTYLSSFDVEDGSNTELAADLNLKKQILSELQKSIKPLNLECQPTTAVPPQTGGANELLNAAPFSRERAKQKKINPGTYGAYVVMASAYQNCPSLEQKVITRQTPALEGIAIVGKHENGVGLKRSIASLSKVQATHPYLDREVVRRSACYNTFDKPLIYDYGGKPFVEGASKNILNLHKNAGSGTDELGIDCSGFVFSALATVGLKIKQDRVMKALDVYSWSARSFMNPATSGMTCLEKVSQTSTPFASGMILANEGHVVMIDQIGQDPFGVQHLKKESDCEQLTTTAFDFSIIQSSNSKNGVGINRYRAADYFLSGNSMTPGLLDYGKAYCRAHFQKRSVAINTNRIGLVRHRSELRACLDQRVAMTHESCVSQCEAL